MARLVISVGALSLWLAVLVMGWSAGGAVYLLLVLGVALFPWGALRARDEEAIDDGAPPHDHASTPADVAPPP